MKTIQVKDKTFRLSLPEKSIIDEVKRVAADINRDYEGKKPLFLCILNGAFMFASDLLKEITIPCQVSFVKLASYQGTASTGQINDVIGLTEPIKGRDVIVVEDIIDTGRTIQHTLDILGRLEPASLYVCSLLCKPSKLEVDLGEALRYVVLQIPDDFIVGYGLDYDSYGRNYRDIYSIIDK